MNKSIAVVDLWTDTNSGDLVLQSGLITMIRSKFPDYHITGIFRFGFNEFDKSKSEISNTLSLLDSYFSGPRRTLYSGTLQKEIHPILFKIFSIYSFIELALNLVLFKVGLTFLVPSKISKSFQAISKADYVFVKGKNYRTFSGLKGIFRYSTLTVASYIANSLNNRCFLVNASFWNIKDTLQLRLYGKLLEKFKKVIVRDHSSLQFLDSLENQKIVSEFSSDLSFYDLKSNHEIPSIKRNNQIALTITSWGSSESRKIYINNIVAIVGRLNEYLNGNAKVVIVPQVTREAENNDDCVNQLIQAFQLKGITCININKKLGIDDLLKEYASSKFLIGTRMHSCVFAYFVKTPFIAITYDKGSKWDIIRDIWNKELVLPYDQTYDIDAVSKNLISEEKNDFDLFEKHYFDSLNNVNIE